MQTTTLNHASISEVDILARLLSNERGRLPSVLAHYLLNLGFGDEDKARMHELAVRNQHDALTHDEKQELLAFGKAGTLLSILKSKAR